MKSAWLFVLVLCSAVAAQASYLPYFDDLRATILARQDAISNAPPITTEGKKELSALRKALTTIDKPSTTLSADLSALSKVVTAINKGASNETFQVKLEAAVSNYIAVLVQTNNALESALADANNNPTLKQKAQDAVNAAKTQLQALNPQSDTGGAAKGLIGALKAYAKAAKAVTVAVNADPAPTPTPKKGQIVIQVAGEVYTYTAGFPLRNADGTGIVGTNSSGGTVTLIVHIPSDGAPGTYACFLQFGGVLDGVQTLFSLPNGEADVTTATSSALVGTISGTGSYHRDSITVNNVTFSARFNAERLFPGFP